MSLQVKRQSDPQHARLPWIYIADAPAPEVREDETEFVVTLIAGIQQIGKQHRFPDGTSDTNVHERPSDNGHQVLVVEEGTPRATTGDEGLQPPTQGCGGAKHHLMPRDVFQLAIVGADLKVGPYRGRADISHCVGREGANAGRARSLYLHFKT